MMKCKQCTTEYYLPLKGDGYSDKYCSESCYIVNLEDDLLLQDSTIAKFEEENAELKKENENLSASIKGMASGKVNLNKSYQDLEGLYERLEKENAELKANWADLKVYIAEDECLEKSFVIEEMNNLERSEEQG